MELRFLPNREGFRFYGETHDGEVIACVVKRDPIGCHSVYREDDGSPCWFQLRGWGPRHDDTAR